jgi:toxin-antitoxin system PIN domain toxin
MMSLDTNVLFYSLNEDCPEHSACLALVHEALTRPQDWIVADQVWFELYRLLRNPLVLRQPLPATEASQKIDWFRSRSGWAHCAWEPFSMEQLKPFWQRDSFPARRTFDLVLALTLKAQGVAEFFTRNTKDFADLDFFTITDPIHRGD